MKRSTFSAGLLGTPPGSQGVRPEPLRTSAPRIRVATVALRVGLGTKRARTVGRALTECFEGSTTGGVALLPGVDEAATEGAAWARDIKSAAREHGVTVLFEAIDNRGVPLFRAYDPLLDRDVLCVEQALTTSAEADRNPDIVDALLRRSAPGGGGSALIGGSVVGLLVCGENNVLRNAQSRRNAVSIRHRPGASIFDHAQIVCNGAHTLMGNWGKLDRRFEYLSARRRCVLYATNYDAGPFTRACRAYVDGRRVATGEATGAS